MDFVSDFVSDYFAFCTCPESISSLHFSHFVLNCFKLCLIYIMDIVGMALQLFQLGHKTSEFTGFFLLIFLEKIKASLT